MAGLYHPGLDRNIVWGHKLQLLCTHAAIEAWVPELVLILRPYACYVTPTHAAGSDRPAPLIDLKYFGPGGMDTGSECPVRVST